MIAISLGHKLFLFFLNVMMGVYILLFSLSLVASTGTRMN